jgi:carbonic anhydrase
MTSANERVWTRRRFLGRASLGAATLPLLGTALASCGNDEDYTPLEEAFPQTPDEALERLLAGNRRYAAHEPLYPEQSNSRKASVAAGQKPFAGVLGCVDSRVPPELIFDQGLGALFSARVAGAIADDAVIGSLEFGVLEFGLALIVVLGHERCGAVAATIEAIEHPTTAPINVQRLVDAIRPAVESTAGQPGDHLDNAVRANTLLAASQLAPAGSVLDNFVREGKLKIVAAVYDLDTAVVSLIS